MPMRAEYIKNVITMQWDTITLGVRLYDDTDTYQCFVFDESGLGNEMGKSMSIHDGLVEINKWLK
jgi:hypothetical protein